MEEATAAFEGYDYARALERTEAFFWSFCDDYVELVKNRAYGTLGEDRAGSARLALRLTLSVLLRLLAPFLPYVTEEVWSWWHDGGLDPREPWPSVAELGALEATPDVLAAASELLGEVRRAKTAAGVIARDRGPFPSGQGHRAPAGPAPGRRGRPAGSGRGGRGDRDDPDRFRSRGVSGRRAGLTPQPVGRTGGPFSYRALVIQLRSPLLALVARSQRPLPPPAATTRCHHPLPSVARCHLPPPSPGWDRPLSSSAAIAQVESPSAPAATTRLPPPPVIARLPPVGWDRRRHRPRMRQRADGHTVQACPLTRKRWDTAASHDELRGAPRTAFFMPSAWARGSQTPQGSSSSSRRKIVRTSPKGCWPRSPWWSAPHPPSPEVGTFNPAMMLHGEESVTLHAPLKVEGTVESVSTVTGIYDKGSGAVITSSAVATDVDTGEPVWTITRSSFIRGEGGWGGDRGPSAGVQIPDREPDHQVTYSTRIDQALLYRLMGDRNPLHSDPKFAARAGFERPILHGLCTFGFTGRALLHTLCGSDPDRLVSMGGRFSKPVFPARR